ncbi:hypothetical protein [Nostoc sp.]|uniref:hypothetical protein n=1 Tax=Nostoc sp. TaxID=1180 RepID=UPI002FEE8538
MDFKNLNWTKSVTPQDELWAYSEFPIHYLFKLNWKDNKINANKPQKNDLILLRQRGYVTHLVKVLDYKSEDDDWQGDFNIYRIVEIIWVISWENPPIFAKADELFGYKEVLHYQGGDVMELNTLPSFNKHWDSNGGLDNFQNRVRTALFENTV